MRLLALCVGLGISPLLFAGDVVTSFLEESFDGSLPSPRAVWNTASDKKAVKTILGESLNVLRIRYWGQDQKSAWILEAIGKEKPITFGFLIENDQIKRANVLAFRESRGWEIRLPAFEQQFINARLDEKLQLTEHIDGITGATLSVRAMKKMARLALYFHHKTPFALSN